MITNVSSSRLYAIRTILGISIAALLPFVIVTTSPSASIYATAIMLAYGVALAATVSPRFGAAFTAGVVLVVVVVAARFALSAAMAALGISLVVPAGLALVLVGLLIPLSQLWLLFAAWRASQPSSTARFAGLLGGVAAMSLAFAAAHAFSTSGRSKPVLTPERRARDEAIRRAAERLHAEMEKLERCPQQYAAENPALGFPKSATLMKSCLPPTFAAENDRFRYWAAPADDSGKVTKYLLCHGGPYPQVFVSDERGTRLGSGSDCNHLDRFLSSFVHVNACLLQYAAMHPDEGYPADLSAISSCRADAAEQLTYQPAARGKDGVIRAFTLSWRHLTASSSP